jgi:hypothetical protein
MDNSSPVSRTRGSSLSQAFATFNINRDAQGRDLSHPGLIVSPLSASKYHCGLIAAEAISLIWISL